jgi:hypothetical protein
MFILRKHERSHDFATNFQKKIPNPKWRLHLFPNTDRLHTK